MTDPTDTLFAYFDRRGADGYSGEAVTQEAHALQCAALAEAAGAGEALVVAALLHDLGHLIHNAGVIRPNLVEAAEVRDIEILASLHLAAPLILLKAVLPAMKAKRHGRVIMLSSRAALGAPTRTAYSATKAGIIGMGRTWALELAPHGITVNMIAPGPIGSTNMFHEIVPAGSERERALARSIPVGRLGTPEDVTNAVMFFAGANAGFVTGQVLYVCGGASVGSVSL